MNTEECKEIVLNEMYRQMDTSKRDEISEKNMDSHKSIATLAYMNTAARVKQTKLETNLKASQVSLLKVENERRELSA